MCGPRRGRSARRPPPGPPPRPPRTSRRPCRARPPAPWPRPWRRSRARPAPSPSPVIATSDATPPSTPAAATLRPLATPSPKLRGRENIEPIAAIISSSSSSSWEGPASGFCGWSASCSSERSSCARACAWFAVGWLPLRDAEEAENGADALACAHAASLPRLAKCKRAASSPRAARLGNALLTVNPGPPARAANGDSGDALRGDLRANAFEGPRKWNSSLGRASTTGSAPRTTATSTPTKRSRSSDLPADWDWRRRLQVQRHQLRAHRRLATESRNQHIPTYCGSSTAAGGGHVGAEAALNDRLKIARKGAYPDTTRSRRRCSFRWRTTTSAGGTCNGGNVGGVFRYMEKNHRRRCSQNYDVHDATTGTYFNYVRRGGRLQDVAPVRPKLDLRIAGTAIEDAADVARTGSTSSVVRRRNSHWLHVHGATRQGAGGASAATPPTSA